MCVCVFCALYCAFYILYLHLHPHPLLVKPNKIDGTQTGTKVLCPRLIVVLVLDPIPIPGSPAVVLPHPRRQKAPPTSVAPLGADPARAPGGGRRVKHSPCGRSSNGRSPRAIHEKAGRGQEDTLYIDMIWCHGGNMT